MAKRAAELYGVLIQADRPKAKARAATVIASLPTTTPEDATVAPATLGVQLRDSG